MRTETELRDLLRTPAETTHPIDLDAVLRRSRRRRAPRQAALRGTVALAVVGIGVAGISNLRTFGTGASSDSAEERAATSDGSVPFSESSDGDESSSGVDPAAGAIQQAPADKLHLCGGQLSEVAPSETGLVLTPLFDAEAAASGSTVEGTVRLTNTGTERVSGVTAATPAMTVSQNGLVLWHTNGMMIMMAAVVDLAPGESMDYRASFTPVRCDVEDDAAESFRDDLPALPPGRYEISAAIDFTPDATAAAPSLITGPASSIQLR